MRLSFNDGVRLLAIGLIGAALAPAAYGQVLPRNRAPAAPSGRTQLKPLRLSQPELRQLEAFLRSLSGGVSGPARYLRAPQEQRS